MVEDRFAGRIEDAACRTQEFVSRCAAERCWAGPEGLPFVAERNMGWEAAPFECEVHELDGGVRLRGVDGISKREGKREREKERR